jgi:uncharacterized membrane protein YccC
MRTQYVVPLLGKITSRIQRLDGEIIQAASAAQRRAMEKERTTLRKHLEELREFDDKLRHLADMRVALDLNDGVLTNYGKLSDVLEEIGLGSKVAYVAEDFDAPIENDT